MVEIREEEDGQQSQAAGDNNTNANAENTQQQNRKTPMEFVKENPNEMLGFVLRLATIYFVLSYLLPLTNPHYQKMAYTKALATAAATNAFRLHQRLRTVNVPFFSQQFLYELMIEDSAHYLLYSIILVMSSPITLALLPISIYALFNIVNFLNKISTEVGFISASLASWLVQIKQQHTANLLSTASCAEIFLFPIIVSMVFMGKTNLFTPFVYYRFLTMRYLSRRNPYTRAMFGQLKLLIFSLANRGGCPTFVRSLIFKSVSFIEQLAPQIPV